MQDQRRGEEAELLDLIRHRSFRQGRFTLSSGRESSLYFNLKPTMMHPRGAYLCARAFLTRIRTEHADYVGGLEMGAVPVIGSLAALSEAEGNPVPTFFVRKAAKAHGTREVIEGLGPDESLAGKRVLVLDDVATTGNAILQAASALRASHAILEAALVLVDREEGAAETLRRDGIRLLSVFRAENFL
ncbi:MAG TPA: orotate phosphoribosyltransferase [Rhizomicrobium sp.]|nr:orotate phosphoribosyltransferase [Rhizomicrobium sp.]